MTTHTARPRRSTRPPAAPSARRRPGAHILLPIAVAVVIALGLIGAAVVQSGSSSSSPAASLPPGASPAAPVLQLVRGIPQQGSALGRADAPVTLVEFADLQCPACKVWEETTLPELIRRYVRQGRLRIEFRGVSIVGADSVTALRYLVAARDQGRMWQFLLNAYAHQGAENAWATPQLLQQIGGEVGLDSRRLATDASSSATTSQLVEWARDGISSTPTVFIGATGSRRFAQVDLRSLAPEGTLPAVEQALAKAG
jgi:protein-disulfide isomerase